jgi:hypothetical protein
MLEKLPSSKNSMERISIKYHLLLDSISSHCIMKISNLTSGILEVKGPSGLIGETISNKLMESFG